MSSSDEYPTSPPLDPLLDPPPFAAPTPLGTASPPESDLYAAAGGGDDGSSSKTEQAKDAAKEVASGAKEEAKSVARQARDQVSSLKSQATDELQRQADERGQQAAGQLRTLSEQLGALAEGRRDDAGPLAGYLDEGRQRIESFASRLEQEGPKGLLDDVASFGRRRPGLFLLGAAVAGVAVGRLVRAGASGDDGNGDTSSAAIGRGDYAYANVGTGEVATGSLETDVYSSDAGMTYAEPAEGPR